MSANTSQIVHESEAQRQHVRVQITAFAILNGHRYSVKDLSNGGVRLIDVRDDYKIGDRIELGLNLPFEKFSLVVDIEAEVEHFDTAKNLLGCKFTDLSDEQISILNNVMKSYISGKIVSEVDVINIVSRNNFVSIRKNKAGEVNLSRADIIKRAIPMAAVSLLGLLAIFFLVGNIFERVSVVKSYNGTVQTENIIVRAQINGLFKPLVSEETKSVSLGDPIAELHSRTLLPYAVKSKKAEDQFISRVETIKSPCDCYIVYQHAQTGEYRSAGEPVFKLVPIDAEPWITVNLPPKDAYRVNIHDDVKLHIGGDALVIEGLVINMDTKGNDSPLSIVKVQPLEPLEMDLVGRPVYAEFFVY